MAPNQPDWCVVFHAVAWAGGTVTTLNPSYTAEEVGHQLRDAGAELLVTVPALLPAARAGAAGTGVREIAVIGAAEGAMPLEALLGEPIAGAGAGRSGAERGGDALFLGDDRAAQGGVADASEPGRERAADCGA